MPGTLWRFEPTRRARIVSELSKLGGVESAGDGVEEGVESGGGGDSFGGEGADVGRGEDSELHA